MFGYVKIKVERDSNENQTTKYYIYLTDKQGHGIVNDQKQSDKLEREDVKVKVATIRSIPAETSFACPYKDSSVTSFADDSLDTIIAAVRNNNTELYHVGDTKEVDLGKLGVHVLRIANKETPVECSTEDFSQTACGFVLEFADQITGHPMNFTTTEYPKGFNKGGWPATEMRRYLQNEFYQMLPNDLKNGIIDTIVISSHGPEDNSNFKSIDKLYLLSTKEIYGVDHYRDTLTNQTRQLDYYRQIGVTASNVTGAFKEYQGAPRWFWLRSATSHYINGFYVTVRTSLDDESTLYNAARVTGGVSPAFRIG